MNRIKKGDKVSRISHGEDIIFEVIKITKNNNNKIAMLKGITERIEVDSPIDDLIIVKNDIVEKRLRSLDYRFERKIQKDKLTSDFRNQETVLGKILHLDGDKRYSEKSYRYYQKMGLTAIVKNVPEYKQPKVVYNLLLYYKPDILVITRT